MIYNQIDFDIHQIKIEKQSKRSQKVKHSMTKILFILGIEFNSLEGVENWKNSPSFQKLLMEFFFLQKVDTFSASIKTLRQIFFFSKEKIAGEVNTQLFG